MVVHAEENALICAGTRARGGTVYVYGKPICPRCAVSIIQAGVRRVVGIQPDPKKNPESDTHKSGMLSLKLFKEGRIEFSPLDPAVLRPKAKKKADKQRKARSAEGRRWSRS
jgi:dCMP deaminase